MHAAVAFGARTLVLAAALFTAASYAAADAAPAPPAGNAVATPKAAETRPKSYTVGGALALADNSGFEFLSVNGPVRLDIGTVTNESATNTSGTVRVALFVTLDPSPIGIYWTIAATQLGTLPPGFHFAPQSITEPYNAPPDGLYYIHMGVFEYEPATCTVASGFCLDDYITFRNRVQVVNGQIFDAGPAPAPRATAVEYYHAAFNHYFVTSIDNEIALLDAGAFQGWQRTGRTFDVWTTDSGQRTSVCRFFSTAFGARSSHFYTPHPDECAIVRTNPDWQFEGIAFFVEYPTPTGACEVGRLPLYRLYNNGMSGAPNHRYTTSVVARQDMLNQGWTPEGFGPLGVIACVPA